MNVFLTEQFTLSTHLTPQEIYNRLDHLVYKRANFLEGFGNKKPSETYEGWYDEESFKIKRIINYRNSFLPVIVGEFVQNGNRSTINIKMAPNLLAKITLPLFLIIPVIAFFVMINTSNAPIYHPLGKFFPLLMIPIAIAGIGSITYYEIRKAKKELITYFDAELVYS